jgi:hypothetical protein
MNGKTIVNLLSLDPSTKTLFTGFISPDKTFEIKHFPALVIINTDESTGTGEHWCVGFYLNKNVCEFFDPFGFPPKNKISGYNLSPSLFKNCNKIHFNKKQVQALNSSTCGHHCIYFSILRSNNISMRNILQKYYSNNPQNNDTGVLKFIDKLKNV